MPVHLKEHIQQNKHIPGIFILNPQLTIGQNIEELLLIAEGSFPDEYPNQIIHLPLTFLFIMTKTLHNGYQPKPLL